MVLLCYFCQLMLEAQNRRIDDLVERIKLQQEKLDKQNVRIRTLQSQVRKQLRIQLKRFCIPHQNKFFFVGILLFFHIFCNLIVDSELISRCNSQDRAATLTAPWSSATHQSVSEARKHSKSPLGTVLSRLDKI